MAVYLVRHAEDLGAAEARLGDLGLSALGRVQAKRTAGALAGLSLDRCVSSPLARALETARSLVAGRAIPLEVEPVFAEGSLGRLEGLSLEAAARAFPEDFRLGSSVVARLAAAGRTAPGGESRERFLGRVERAHEFVARALARDHGNLLVVSHGGLLNYLLQRLLRIPARDEVPFGFDHCGLLRVVSYREADGFGPFPMLRAAAPSAPGEESNLV
ncbi:MAG: histidine phosphatase family protein [Myxococcales bacterium]|nr:histidine phosphatase family protein [Myxococcales bacterium]